MEEILETFDAKSDSGNIFHITTIRKTGLQIVVSTGRPVTRIIFIESSGAIVKKLKDGSFKILFDHPVIVRRA